MECARRLVRSAHRGTRDAASVPLDNRIGLQTVDRKMPGRSRDPDLGADVLSTEAQMPGPHGGAEFGTFETAESIRSFSDTA